jgi:hypothetical protein
MRSCSLYLPASLPTSPSSRPSSSLSGDCNAGAFSNGAKPLSLDCSFCNKRWLHVARVDSSRVNTAEAFRVHNVGISEVEYSRKLTNISTVCFNPNNTKVIQLFLYSDN